jgi:serine/threonine protein kinase
VGSGLTQAGDLVGTPGYMSPEQALVDHRSDIFSLGVVLYELLTGQRPFTGANFAEVIDKIIHAQPTAIARLNYDVPPELERITLKCLQKQPDRRYQSARELLVDLKNLRRELDAVQDVTAQRPAAMAMEAAIAGPSDLANSDVVIAYANLDDQPLMSGRQGWISQLHQNLQVRVAQLSGRRVAVVKHSDRAAPPEFETEVLKQIPHAKTVVSVLSPPFVQSNGCRRVVESFWKGTTALC